MESKKKKAINELIYKTETVINVKNKLMKKKINKINLWLPKGKGERHKLEDWD